MIFFSNVSWVKFNSLFNNKNKISHTLIKIPKPIKYIIFSNLYTFYMYYLKSLQTSLILFFNIKGWISSMITRQIYIIKLIVIIAKFIKHYMKNRIIIKCYRLYYFMHYIISSINTFIWWPLNSLRSHSLCNH